MTTHPTSDPWPAPAPGVPVRATVHVPGSKSLTARHLVVSALADRPSVIDGALNSRDTQLMVTALRSLGTEITWESDLVTVTPAPFHSARIDTGLAGTVLRFLAAAAITARGDVEFDGDPAMRKRPLQPLVTALRDLGVRISQPSSGDSLPLTIYGGADQLGSAVAVDASASSQFVSALLLIGARLPDGLTITHTGAGLPSLPHIDMTCEVLRSAGAVIDQPSPTSWHVHPGALNPGCVTVEPDLSNAAPFLAAAMVTGGEVTINRWPRETTQAGARAAHIFEALGATISYDDGALTLAGPDHFDGLDLDLGDAGEITPTIAAVLAFARTPSRLRGIGHLRGHETDRLAAITAELTRLGGQVTEEADGLTITPQPLHRGLVRTYDDHRMATFGAILGLRVPGVTIENIGTTAKTLPDFPALWEEMTKGTRS